MVLHNDKQDRIHKLFQVGAERLSPFSLLLSQRAYRRAQRVLALEAALRTSGLLGSVNGSWDDDYNGHQLAVALTEQISKSEMPQRLSRICYGDWCYSEIEHLDLIRGRITLRSGGTKLYHGSPCFLSDLLIAFPELLPLVIKGSTIHAHYAPGYLPPLFEVFQNNESSSGPYKITLEGLDPAWEILSVTEGYSATNVSDVPVEDVRIGGPYGSADFGTLPAFSTTSNDHARTAYFPVPVENIKGHVGEIVGPFTLSGSAKAPQGDPYWHVNFNSNGYWIEYTGAGGDPCPSNAPGALLLGVPPTGACGDPDECPLPDPGGPPTGGTGPGSPGTGGPGGGQGQWGLPVVGNNPFTK